MMHHVNFFVHAEYSFLINLILLVLSWLIYSLISKIYIISLILEILLYFVYIRKKLLYLIIF